MDVKIALHDIERENLTDWYVLPTAADDYQIEGLEYIPGLHDRLVIELVTSASPPHIAVSSLAAISYRRFDLIIRIGTGDEVLSKTYEVILKGRPAPPPEIVKPMPPAEMLNYLVTKLAAAQNTSAAKVWGKLKALTTSTQPDGAYNFIVYLSSINLDARFIIGIEALLSEYQNTIFNKVSAESGDTRAVAAVLFGQQDFLILKELFGQANQHSLTPGTTKSEQLEFAREQAAILQNKIYGLEYSTAQQNATAPQHITTEQTKQEGTIRWMDYRTWLDYQNWLNYLEWGKKPLLSNAKIWIAATAILGILLLLLSIRLLRTPVAATATPKRIVAPLPGQIELENLHASQVHINPFNADSKEQTDETVSKLNQAEAYIEMGYHDKARNLLKQIEKQSKSLEQLTRMRSLQDKIKA